MISLILPCRNEEQTVAEVIRKARAALESHGKPYEIIVADSSRDRSAEIAKQAGAKVVRHNKAGYGAALHVGFSAARGNILAMADADDTYDLRELPRLIHALEDADLVLGTRLKGTIKRGAMPLLHRYLGNPLLSFLFRRFFRLNVSDTHCGMRVIRKEAFERMDLQTTGMEYASEMLIEAARKGMKVKEAPITYWPRKGHSKLRSFNDGWKHLRFMLLYSPSWLYLLPGSILFLLGSTFTLLISMKSISIGGYRPDIHPLFASSLLMIIGYTIILMGIFAKTYAVEHLEEKDRFISWLNSHISLERGIMLATLIMGIGVLLSLRIAAMWAIAGYGALEGFKSP